MLSAQLEEIIECLGEVARIEAPEEVGDEDIINSDRVFNYLAEADQDTVREAVDMLYSFVRDTDSFGVIPNKRAISDLRNAGFHAVMQQAQYDDNRLEGYVDAGRWRISLTD